MSSRPDDAPHGESDVWGLISTLVAGPAVWGAVGYGVDQLVDTSRPVFTPVGVVVGFLTSFYIVYVRYGRDDPPPPTTGDRR